MNYLPKPSKMLPKVASHVHAHFLKLKIMNYKINIVEQQKQVRGIHM